MPAYGCIPDTRDVRDHKFAAALTTTDDFVLPDAHDLTAMFPPVMDQELYSTCTCFAATEAYRYNLINTDQPDMPLAIAQLYWDAGVIEGSGAADNGRQIRDVVKALASTGVARADLWPYDQSMGLQPTPEVYADAASRTIIEYQRVELNRTSINTAIYVGHPIIIGIPVFPEFESDEVMGTGIVPMPHALQTEIGWHAMLLGAYDPQWDTVLNSWNTWFGLPEKKGYCKLPRGYLEKFGSDLWTIFQNKQGVPNA